MDGQDADRLQTRDMAMMAVSCEAASGIELRDAGHQNVAVFAAIPSNSWPIVSRVLFDTMSVGRQRAHRAASPATASSRTPRRTKFTYRHGPGGKLMLQLHVPSDLQHGDS